MTDDPTVPGQDPNAPDQPQGAQAPQDPQPPQEPTSLEKPQAQPSEDAQAAGPAPTADAPPSADAPPAAYPPPTDAPPAAPYSHPSQPPAGPQTTGPVPTGPPPAGQAPTGPVPTGAPPSGAPAASPMYPTPPGANYPAPGTYSAGAGYPAPGAAPAAGANPSLGANPPGAYPPPSAAPAGQYPPGQYLAGQYPGPGTYPDAKPGWGNGKILALVGAIVLLLGAGGIGGLILLNGNDDAQDGANDDATATTTMETTAQTPLRISPALILPTEAQIEAAGLQRLIKTSPEPGTGLTAATPTDPVGCEYVVEPYNQTVFGPAVALARYNYTNTGNTKTYAVYAQAKAAVFEDASAAVAAVSKISAAVNNPNCTSFRVTSAASGKDGRSTKPGASEEGKVFWTVGFPGEAWNCSHDMQTYRNILVFGSWCNYSNTSAATQVSEEMIKNIKAKAPN